MNRNNLLLPRRPERTRDRGSPKFPPPKVFHERQLARCAQVISTTTDRVHIRHGSRSVLLFSSPDVEILERAIRASKSGFRTSCVGRIALRFDPDAYIEVGAGGDRIRIRIMIKGEAKHHVLLVHDEVIALAAAVDHFKTTSTYAEFRKSPAAEAAIEKETSNDEFR